MTEGNQEPNKIKISLEDLNTEAVNQRVQDMQAAQKVVMVRQVGKRVAPHLELLQHFRVPDFSVVLLHFQVFD